MGDDDYVNFMEVLFTYNAQLKCFWRHKFLIYFHVANTINYTRTEWIHLSECPLKKLYIHNPVELVVYILAFYEIRCALSKS